MRLLSILLLFRVPTHLDALQLLFVGAGGEFQVLVDIVCKKDLLSIKVLLLIHHFSSLLTIPGSLLLSNGLLGALYLRVQTINGLHTGAALVCATMVQLLAAIELIGDKR